MKENNTDLEKKLLLNDRKRSFYDDWFLEEDNSVCLCVRASVSCCVRLRLNRNIGVGWKRISHSLWFKCFSQLAHWLYQEESIHLNDIQSPILRGRLLLWHPAFFNTKPFLYRSLRCHFFPKKTYSLGLKFFTFRIDRQIDRRDKSILTEMPPLHSYLFSLML